MIEKYLTDAVNEVIETGLLAGMDFDDEAFENLACAIAREQGRLRDGRPLTPELAGLDRIDPLPETAYKMMTVATFPPSEAEAEFETSGTSAGTRGRLLVRDMDLYRRSVLKGFKLFCMYGTTPKRFLSLIPPGEERPKSSLSWMASFVLDAFDNGRGGFVAKQDGLDGDSIFRIIGAACDDESPLFLMGTSLDFLALFDFLIINGSPVRLPAGSRLMHTGGAKASGREITRAELAADAGKLLGISEQDVIEEFGMTELFSQAYDSPRVSGGQRRLVPVPWMRTRVLDPRTMRDVAEGERGMLVHYDLAACHTAVALMAADTAVRIGDGFGSIVRATGAAARGCSHGAASSISGRRSDNPAGSGL